MAAGEELGWDVVLKATAERLRQRPDLAHVWRNIDDADEMRDAWDSADRGSSPTPPTPSSSCSGRPRPACRSRIGGLEDPLFGPAVSFGVSGALTELVGDRAYRIPPISALDALETVRSIKAAPLLFGYRGSEQVDVAAVEDLIRRVAQLKNDLPQVSSIDLMLVHATADGVSVLHADGAGRSGGRPPLGLVRPPADGVPRGHAAGLTAARVTDWHPCVSRPRTMRVPPRPVDDLSWRSSRPATTRPSWPPVSVAPSAGEQVVSFLVHHEPTIDRDEVRRHITVVVLTPTRLILCHTDEHAPDDLLPAALHLDARPRRSGSTRCAPSWSTGWSPTRAEITATAVPAPAEAVLTIGWGGVNRIDLEPAVCSDPECEADHGYTGVLASDDFSLRLSSAADGQAAVDRLLAFAETLSASTHG